MDNNLAFGRGFLNGPICLTSPITLPFSGTGPNNKVIAPPPLSKGQLEILVPGIYLMTFSAQYSFYKKRAVLSGKVFLNGNPVPIYNISAKTRRNCCEKERVICGVFKALLKSGDLITGQIVGDGITFILEQYTLDVVQVK